MVAILTRKRLAIVVALAAATSFLLLQRGSESPVGASSGVPIYGTCKGAKTGVIKGEATTKGREGQWEISALSDGISVPIEAASGQVTGRRQHKPLTITMTVGKATPQLINALNTNENLTQCTFNFVRPNLNGVAKNYFRIELRNAHLIDYSLTGRQTGSDTNSFSFAYETIAWTYLDGAIKAEDDWGNPTS